MDLFPLVVEQFPALSQQIVAPAGNPYLGGQNFTFCCIKALNAVLDGSAQNLVTFDISQNGNNSQFPCGAAFAGNRSGVSVVKSSYYWCDQNCPGFELSRSSKLNQWLQPFVGFILPAVIFSLSVPRRKKLHIPTWVFPEKFHDPIRLIKAIVCAVVAATIVAIDTMLWLFAVFALAGPILLSAMYEAWIDKRVLQYISEKINNHRLTVELRAKIMLAVLVGNLDLDSAWDPAMGLTAATRGLQIEGPPQSAIQQVGLQKIERRLKSMLECQYSFGSTIGAAVVFYMGSFIYGILEITSTLGDNDTSHALAFGMWWTVLAHISIMCGCLLAGNNPNTLEGITPNSQTNSLDRQPVPHRLFRALVKAKNYLFQPTYNANYKPAWMWDRGRNKREWLLRVCQTNINDSNNSEAVKKDLHKLEQDLALGPGNWVVLSFFAFALYAVPCVLGGLQSYWTPQVGLSCRSLTFFVYGSAQTWLLLLWIWNLTGRYTPDRARRHDMNSDRAAEPPLATNTTTKEPRVTGDNVEVSPGVTPVPPYEGTGEGDASLEKGFIRRTATTEEQEGTVQGVLTGVTQLLTAHWFEYRLDPVPRANASGRRQSVMDSFRQTPKISRVGFTFFWTLMFIGLLASTFTAIGGTLMQIVGVYRNCLCKLNVRHWRSSRDVATMLISSNNKVDIDQATITWRSLGYSATGFLGLTCFVGWWYQRRLRFQFGQLMDRLDNGVKWEVNHERDR